MKNIFVAIASAAIMALALFVRVSPASAVWYHSGGIIIDRNNTVTPKFHAAMGNIYVYPDEDGFMEYDQINCAAGSRCVTPGYGVSALIVEEGYPVYQPTAFAYQANKNNAGMGVFDFANPGSMTYFSGTLKANTNYIICLTTISRRPIDSRWPDTWNYQNDLACHGAFTTSPLPTSTSTPTPIYQMDAGVASSGGELLGSLTMGLFGIIPAGIAIVGGTVTTLFGLRWLIGFVRKFV